VTGTVGAVTGAAGGLLGGDAGGLLGGLTGSNGLVGGLTGNNGVLGGLTGGLTGGSGLVGGLLNGVGAGGTLQGVAGTVSGLPIVGKLAGGLLGNLQVDPSTIVNTAGNTGTPLDGATGQAMSATAAVPSLVANLGGGKYLLSSGQVLQLGNLDNLGLGAVGGLVGGATSGGAQGALGGLGGIVGGLPGGDAVKGVLNGVTGNGAVGGLTGQLGGLTGQLGGLTGQLGGASGQLGSLTGQVGGLTGQLGQPSGLLNNVQSGLGQGVTGGALGGITNGAQSKLGNAVNGAVGYVQVGNQLVPVNAAGQIVSTAQGGLPAQAFGQYNADETPMATFASSNSTDLSGDDSTGNSTAPVPTPEEGYNNPYPGAVGSDDGALNSISKAMGGDGALAAPEGTLDAAALSAGAEPIFGHGQQPQQGWDRKQQSDRFRPTATPANPSATPSATETAVWSSTETPVWSSTVTPAPEATPTESSESVQNDSYPYNDEGSDDEDWGQWTSASGTSGLASASAASATPTQAWRRSTRAWEELYDCE
jgi:hypothetical protein